jgi:hypothetical protein
LPLDKVRFQIDTTNDKNFKQYCKFKWREEQYFSDDNTGLIDYFERDVLHVVFIIKKEQIESTVKLEF